MVPQCGKREAQKTVVNKRRTEDSIEYVEEEYNINEMRIEVQLHPFTTP